jgi:hypothetical protein
MSHFAITRKTAWPKLWLFLAVLLAVESLPIRTAWAQTSYTWNKTGNSSWKNNINWLPNVNNQSYPHVLGDSATFNLNAGTASATPNLNTSVIISALTVNAASSATNYGLTIGAGTPTTSTITFQTTSGDATYTENADPSDGIGVTLITAGIQLNSNLDIYQNHDISANSSTDFAGLLSAASGITLTKSGNGNLQLDTAPTGPGLGFQGSAVINGGAIRITNNVLSNAASVAVNSGGQLELAQPVTGTVTDFNLGGSLVLNGTGKDPSTANYDGVLRFDNQSVAANFNSPVQLQSNSNIFVDANLSPPTGPATYGQLTLTQTVSGTGGLTLDGPGNLVLVGSNTYGTGGGGTTVTAGSHLVVSNTAGSATGAGAVTIHGTLAGGGIIAGPVSFVGGTLAPSNGGAAPASLTVGSTSLDASSTINYQLGTPGSVGRGVNDLTVVNGNLTLAGTLNVTNLAGFGVGVYELFDYTGSLTDKGLALGSLPTGFTFKLDESTPGKVDLDVIQSSVLPGDVNHDGIVNGLDINLVASHWLNAGVGIPGDANGDGVVNGLDINSIASHWLATSNGAQGALVLGANSATNVPEPSSLLLIAVGAAALACVSRRYCNRL